jgi:3-oxoacyl-[acyl-carrier-protein] synthase-3
MRLKFVNKKILGVLLVLPKNEQSFLEDMKKFEMPESRSLKLMELMGYDKHRLVKSNICSSDLVIDGLRYLFRKGLISNEKIDALIVVTQTPDYLIPPTSSVIQGELGLKEDMICLDINQGCAGYLVGLMQAFSLLDQESINHVILVNVDVLSRKVSERDRNSYPLIGDAASITLISSEQSDQIWANIKTDGTRREALMIPAGGMKMPSSTKTSEVTQENDNNFRSLDNLRMDGTAVFNFVQTEVPPLIQDLFKFSDKTDNDVFGYAFHQPNRFMLEKLADKLKIHPSKMPMDVVQRFGNSSGVTIPTVLATNFSKELMKSKELYCLSGFGVGLTWASMLLSIGPLEFCESITYDGE